MDKKFIPFADFKPMHDEIRPELNMAYHRVLDNSSFIQGKVLCRRSFWTRCYLPDLKGFGHKHR